MKFIITALIVAVASLGTALPSAAQQVVEQTQPVVGEVPTDKEYGPSNWTDILDEWEEGAFDSPFVVVLGPMGFGIAPAPNGVTLSYAYLRAGDTIVLSPRFNGGYFEVFLDLVPPDIRDIRCGFYTVTNEDERVRFHRPRECPDPVA